MPLFPRLAVATRKPPVPLTRGKRATEVDLNLFRVFPTATVAAVPLLVGGRQGMW